MSDVLPILTLLILTTSSLVVGGLAWLWRKAPTVESAAAARSLIGTLWFGSATLASVASAIWVSDPTATVLFSAAIPFLLPAVLNTFLYQRTFRRIGAGLFRGPFRARTRPA